jgi:5'-3' exonuclease
MEPKRLLVIDGYSLLYRAFFATRYLSTSDGRPTNALFGFTSMLFTLLERVKPNAVVVAMDAPGNVPAPRVRGVQRNAQGDAGRAAGAAQGSA